MTEQDEQFEHDQTESIQSDYLWDGSGPVDPDAQRLESVLGELRYQPTSEVIGAIKPVQRRRWLTAAAVLMLTISGSWIAMALIGTPGGSSELDSVAVTWPVESLRGEILIGSQQLAGSGSLRVGQWLETADGSQAELTVANIGRVTIDSGSRLRLVETQKSRHELELERGRIEAFITAPPRLFFVHTPAATAVDLGCKYNLVVDERGDGILEVTLGSVSFESVSNGVDARESYVPRGAVCRMKKGIGPGTPYYDDAPAQLQQELKRFDFEGGGEDALRTVLKEARVRDALTVWHLIMRVSDGLREEVCDRLAQLAPLPTNVDRARVLQGDRDALQRWRNAFDASSD